MEVLNMFKYIPLERQIAIERGNNAKLKAENIKLKGDVDYIAMMTDIELDDDKESEESENA
jgi:hypothetical protein